MKSSAKGFILAASTLLFVLLSASTLLGARVTKSFSEQFKASEGMQVRIDNRFGQVNIESWDTPSVSIEVTVWAEATRHDRAMAILEAIDVSIDQVNNQIRAITKIDERAMRPSGRIFSSSSNEFRIDYNVKMPKNLDLNLKHKYGDAFIDHLDGRVTIDLKYGNLKANSFTRGATEPLNSLELGSVSYTHLTLPTKRIV